MAFKNSYFNKIRYTNKLSFGKKTFVNITSITPIFSSYYYNFFKIFLKLPKNASVLEVGIAAGPFTNFMHSLRPDLKYYGLDFSDVKNLLPSYVNFIKADATNFNLDKEFDFIVSNHLIEHIDISKVNNVIENIYNHLKKGKYFWITTPTFSYNFFDDPTHIRPYTKITLFRLLKMNSFKNIHTKEGYNFNFPYIIKNFKFNKQLKLAYGWARK